MRFVAAVPRVRSTKCGCSFYTFLASLMSCMRMTHWSAQASLNKQLISVRLTKATFLVLAWQQQPAHIDGVAIWELSYRKQRCRALPDNYSQEKTIALLGSMLACSYSPVRHIIQAIGSSSKALHLLASLSIALWTQNCPDKLA